MSALDALPAVLADVRHAVAAACRRLTLALRNGDWSEVARAKMELDALDARLEQEQGDE